MITLPEFVSRWAQSTLTERAAAQSHFTELCAVLGKPSPTVADPTGERYAFEKGVTKTGGGSGFADVWMRGHFAIEYKRNRNNLSVAYQQLLNYREDLENPPLLVVCDLNRFEVHTNFTDTVKRVFKFTLADLLANEIMPSCGVRPLDVLRALFEDPDRLRPTQTTAQVTEKAAAEFGAIAKSLTQRGAEPHVVARFLIRLLFCLFAEDIGLLPPSLFTAMLQRTRTDPERFTRRCKDLFAAMATGGEYGNDDIKHFNGGLFDDNQVLELTTAELSTLAKAADLDWSSIEPSIFGTLFERSLDPAKRSQLGAHYTSAEDIRLIVEPVLMAPLRRRWKEVQNEASALLEKRDAIVRKGPGYVLSAKERSQATRLDQQITVVLRGFIREIEGIRVLDPACGSGNFLYVALRSLLDLQKAVITWAGAAGLTGFFPTVGPEQMRGIELNDYAHELAPITVWIGFIQWLRDNGFGEPEQPILRKLEPVVQMDAILGVDAEGKDIEPAWPEADIIIGNPPFLNGSKMRRELGSDYAERLWELYSGRIAGKADLVTYWFERARALISTGKLHRAGFICTNGIRFGANRAVLERIKQSGDLFMAWDDRPWLIGDADLRVSMVGFDSGTEKDRTLNGVPVTEINVDLTADRIDTTTAKPLQENQQLAFQGVKKGGAFDIDNATAKQMLSRPANPTGLHNRNVIKPRVAGRDITDRPRGGWVIDFGVGMSEDDAALFQEPFAHLEKLVKPKLAAIDRARSTWWLHERSRPDMRAALSGLSRYIVTPEVAKYRIFVWSAVGVLPDSTCHIVAREDDYFFGVLHSRIHELWSLAVGNRMGVGNDPRYNSSRTFGTFPMPWPPGLEPSAADSKIVSAIADAARLLVDLRGKWLNPERATEAELKKRTLTNLYNDRPTWLANIHRRLDEAVAAAYEWPVDLTDDEILARLLALNQERSSNSRGESIRFAEQ